MINNVQSVNDSVCTGCGGCENVCPFDAVEMAENTEGFIVPYVDDKKCVNCGQCIKSCPALNVKHNNFSLPDLYAAWAKNDDVRSSSSSGGLFTLLSQLVISDGGIIYGAAFDDKMQLKHIAVNSIEKLETLKGSKYVQSSTGKIYRDIKINLEDGIKVLFSGTPCQVAALRSYLGKEYENLYTVDVICHGVPSQHELKLYLNELKHRLGISENVQVRRINFRDKRFGWTSEHIVVEFENGTVYHSDLSKDNYVKMFFKNLGLRKSCSDCPFSVYPRQGDISIGDFWGISKIDTTLNDGKGTSLVLINTEKGRDLFLRISKKDIFAKKIDFDPQKVGNRTKALYPSNKNRTRFFALLKQKNFNSSVDMALNGTYDVGIVSNWYAANFGGSLTQYALYHTVEDMGFSALMIERPADSLDKTSIKSVQNSYIDIPYPPYAYAKQYGTKEQMRELNKYCEKFLVGSDQLFQYTLYSRLGKYVTLDWVNDTKLKIAYAASYGHDRIWGSREDLAEMAYFIQKFDYFSVREESGVEITKNNFKVITQVVLDPVFLCNQKHYDELIAKSKRIVPEKYIAGYILDPDKNKCDIIKYVKSKKQLPEEIYSELGYSQKYIEPLTGVNVVQMKIEERLQSIKNCQFFITDSFHGTCFAIIFKKPFIAILNEKRGGSRFRSLLKTFHLENRLINNVSEIENRPELLNDIDYDRVYEILDNERTRCLSWLKTALSDNKLKTATDYDMMQQIFSLQQQSIKKLQSETEKLSRRLEALTGMLNIGFVCKTDFIEYLTSLNNQKSRYLICISVKDTPGIVFKQEYVPFMKKLGLKTNLCNQHWHSYIALINNGKTIYEKLGDISETTEYTVAIKDIVIKLTSSGYKAENRSEIIIDGTDYSNNLRGINFVVFDKANHQLVDSVTFDTNVSSAVCSR